MEYKVIGQTAASDPGNGCMRFNTASQNDATELYFDLLSTGNVDQSASFAAMAVGNIINFQQKDNTNVVGSFIINTITDNVGWYTLGVEPGSSTGFPIVSSRSAIVTCDTGAAAFGGHTFEYHIEHFNLGGLDEEYLTILNALGAQGWEFLFVTNFKTDDGQSRGWFRRQTA